MIRIELMSQIYKTRILPLNHMGTVQGSSSYLPTYDRVRLTALTTPCMLKTRLELVW